MKIVIKETKLLGQQHQLPVLNNRLTKLVHLKYGQSDRKRLIWRGVNQEILN